MKHLQIAHELITENRRADAIRYLWRQGSGIWPAALVAEAEQIGPSMPGIRAIDELVLGYVARLAGDTPVQPDKVTPWQIGYDVCSIALIAG